MSSLNEKMEANAFEAMKLTRKFFVVELDFSESSVEQLDTLVNDADFMMPGGKSYENVELLTRVWGSYLGEVMRRNMDGQWRQNSEDDPPAIEVAGKTVNPHEKIRSRLQGTDDETIAEFYKNVQNAT